jgi:hypothetical protein
MIYYDELIDNLLQKFLDLGMELEIHNLNYIQGWNEERIL